MIHFDMEPVISVVSPCYQAENMVEELVTRIHSALSGVVEEFEIVLVEDGSKDATWRKIEELGKKFSNLRGIKLSRNFGQHHAITAGLHFAKGTWVVVMDCDLQDKPEEIPKLYREALRGYDIVSAKRSNRKDSIFRLISSDINHKVFSFLTNIQTNRSLGNFGIYHRKVIDAFNSLQEYSRSFGVLIQYLGFDRHEIEVEHSQRHSGRSSYTFFRLLAMSVDMVSAFSNKPLVLSATLGFLISLTAFATAVYNVGAKYAGLVGVEGFTATIFSIWFSTGVILLNMGIIGIYLGKVFDQTKGRPQFIVHKKVNCGS